MPKNQDIIAMYSHKSCFTGKRESIGNEVKLCRAYIRAAACADEAVVFEDEVYPGLLVQGGGLPSGMDRT